MTYQSVNPYDGNILKRLPLIVGIAVGMNAGVALAQHEQMPGHENMPPGDHAKHTKTKKDGDADKKQPPKSDDHKHEGHWGKPVPGFGTPRDQP